MDLDRPHSGHKNDIVLDTTDKGGFIEEEHNDGPVNNELHNRRVECKRFERQMRMGRR